VESDEAERHRREQELGSPDFSGTAGGYGGGNRGDPRTIRLHPEQDKWARIRYAKDGNVNHRAGVRPRDGKGGNVSEVTPHTLRRTFGSYLLNKGLGLEDVSKLLGHSNIRVTQECYAELLDKIVEERFYAALSA
jgi:integrase